MDLRTFPKVELHRHLEGALRFSTLIELAKKAGMEAPSEPLRQRDFFLVESPMRDLATVLNKFSATQSLLSSKEVLKRITYEAIEDAYLEGINLLELRYAPTFIQKNHEHLSFEDIHSAILEGIKAAKKFPIGVGLICIFQRTLPLSTSQKVLDFAIETKDTWVGVDLADDEDSFPAKNFIPLFEKAKKHGFKITIHAGETNSPHSPQNVIDAIELLHADRIGHGLQIIKNPKALDLVIKKQIPLELCPTSNWLTNAVPTLQAHPIRKLMEKGVRVTINSDDPGIFGIDLTNEYALLEKDYGFTEGDFRTVNKTALEASFLSSATKKSYFSTP